MANTALNQYLAAQFGIDVSAFDGAGGGQRAMREAGIQDHQRESVINGFTRSFDPVTGAAKSASSYGDVYGGSAASHAPAPGDMIGMTSLVNGYEGTIQDLLDQFGVREAEWEARFAQQGQAANSLRNQILFSGNGTPANSAGVSSARYTGAGRSRRGLLGGSPSGDASLGAQLI